MVKGRIYAPSARRENHWFCTQALTKELDKPTLKAVVSPLTAARFQAKASQMACGEFPFSKHDNRNMFQGHGIYFGGGLGKRMLPKKKYQCSDNLLPLVTKKMPNSCYTASYRLNTTSGGMNSYTQNRRYPHSHTTKSAKRPSTKTAELLSPISSPYKTPLHVLAITQEPFLQANAWMYSYKPKEYNKLLGP